jgi:diguanylate cyclase (GGDEF)-like protein
LQDAAELLYLQGAGGVAVAAVVTVLLVAMSHDPASHRWQLPWLVVMLFTLACRAADIVIRRTREPVASRSGERDMLRFGLGVTITATLWAVYPPLFFYGLDEVQRTSAAIILSAMAGGGASVLAASRKIATIYCAALLLPEAITFLTIPGRENTILGALGIVFFVVMAISAKVTNRSTMTALRLNRINARLMSEMAGERERTQSANDELKAAQAALGETLASLELRIKARTADLEREIAERERFAQELARVASIDSLTGLYNRQTLATRLEDTLARAQRSGTSVAVLFVDLDNFKEVNDVKGHQAGDEVLRVVAKRLSAKLPAGTTWARWGGDEFVVVLTDADNAGEIARIGAVLRHDLSLPIEIGTEHVRVGATIGIALFPEHGRTYDELIRAADVAMYAGKQDGRATVRLFDPTLAEELRERHLLEQTLREAVASRALSLVFQPIVETASGRCEAMEALLRWNHPERGLIFPGEFISLAERSGEIVPIGRWVLSQACAIAATWPGNPAPAVSVNVSVPQILSGSLVDDILQATGAAGLPAHRLHIEVTESFFARDAERIIPVLAALRELGVRVSLDDFGTGFSSLAYLKTLPIDTIKIDQSFVQAIETDSSSIVEAILSIGRALGMDVIAEGVETQKQSDLLRSLGIRHLQGYLFSRPLAEAAAREWLVSHT